MGALCRVEMLGGLRVLQRERTITRFATQKAGALLAYLAYHQRPHPREVLAELLWPWSVPESGRLSLRVALASLRRQLEPPGVPRGTVLQADRLAMQLVPSAVTTDVSDFKAALSAAAGAGSELERMHCLSEAVAFYGGPLLPGYYEDWVLPEQARLGELYLEALTQLTAALEVTGDNERALDYARRAVAADPVREASHCTLMRLLAATGQPAAALRQYGELERILREQLGEGCSAATQQLAARIAEGGAAAQLPEPPARRALKRDRASVRDLPPGTLTVLLTAVEAVGRSGEEGGRAPARVQAVHRRIVREEMAQWGGREMRTIDGILVLAFPAATDALSCAVAVQRRLSGAVWPAKLGPRRARMAIHTGEPRGARRSYAAVVAPARELLLAAHGGQVLCAETAAALLRPGLPHDVTLVALGLYHLPGTKAPQNLYAVDYPDRESRTFPSPNAPPAYPSNLPSPLTRFFGRDEELAHLHDVVCRRQTRVVTLTGPGGTGKTRLGLEAGSALLDDLSGAVWFVPLQDLADARLIPGALADAVGLPRLPHVDPLEQAMAALAVRPSLVILDSADLLVEEAAPLLQRLAEGAPNLCCLVTSRRRLNLAGEVEVRVGPLPTPGGAAHPQELIRYPSVALFVDRSQAIRPDFQVTAGNAAAVAELCDRLEGIPLALELAAARAQVLTPGQMVARLSDRFEWLETRRRGGADRHRTLRSALDWSFQLLPPELQKFFARLSVFRGGWTGEAAAVVCEEPDALRSLERLLEYSLVVVRDGSAGTGETRFGLLETLREHGAEKLPARARRQLSRRHAEYYLALVEEAEPQLAGPDQARWLARLQAEHDNLRAALEWARTTRGMAEHGLRLAAAAAPFWRLQGYLSEGRSHIEHALARPAEAPAALRAKGLTQAGQLASRQGDLAAAGKFLGQALEIWRAVGNTEGLAECLNALGVMELWSGPHLERARDLHEEAASICRQAGLQHQLAGALDGLAHVYPIMGRVHDGRVVSEEYLALARQLGNLAELGRALHIIGCVAAWQGDWPGGHAYFAESLAVRRQLGEKWGLGETLYDMGNACVDAGELAGARAYFEECLTTDQDLQFPQGMAFATSGLARVEFLEGRDQSARALWEQALGMFRALRFPYGCGLCLSGLSRLALRAGDPAGARTLLQEGLASLFEVKCEGYAPIYLRQFAALCVTERRWTDAARLLGAADALLAAGAFAIQPIDQDEYRDTLARTREALGDEAFEAAWAEGQAPDWQTATRGAMDEGQPMPPTTDAQTTASDRA